MIRCRDPKPSALILCQSKNRVIQRFRGASRHLETAGAQESEARCGADPKNASRVFHHAMDIVRGQAFVDGVTAPSIVRERPETIGRRKPHGPVGTFEYRRNSIRS